MTCEPREDPEATRTPPDRRNAAHAILAASGETTGSKRTGPIPIVRHPTAHRRTAIGTPHATAGAARGAWRATKTLNQAFGFF
jgi:hypothetical protein